ncbi:MAG: AI-2E family transporter, partial [Gammaproteobacteria bacterium]|nr:AI-2E family transporter [Gammaproteobacteria bacterium]
MNNPRMIFGLLFAAGAGWLVYLLAPILMPFLVAALLAYLGNPLVTWLTRLR